jgi:hypothetical protein
MSVRPPETKRQRFETLAGLLHTLRLDQEAIRSGNRLAADDAMVRQNRVIERLCALAAVMRAEADFRKIDDLLAQAEDVPCG